MNGHTGYNPAGLATTAAAGHIVHRFGQMAAAGGTHTGIAQLKFQPRANRIGVPFRDPLLNPQRTDLFRGDHWAGTPQFARPQTPPHYSIPKQNPGKKAGH